MKVGLESCSPLSRRAITGKEDVKGLREDNTRREDVTSFESSHLAGI